jgi:hypothetical protein
MFDVLNVLQRDRQCCLKALKELYTEPVLLMDRRQGDIYYSLWADHDDSEFLLEVFRTKAGRVLVYKYQLCNE